MKLQFKSLKDLAKTLKVLSNEKRLALLASLAQGRKYPKELSEELGIAYPLVHLQLKNLEKRGLVFSNYEVGTDKSSPYVKRYFELVDFEIVITPELIKELANLNDEKIENEDNNTDNEMED